MSGKTLSSVTDQVTDLLRQGMIQGKWQCTLPGRERLALELGCSHKTMEIAMRRLSKEGLLVSQGPGRRRRINLDPDKIQGQGLNVKVLHYEDADQRVDFFLELIFRLQETGHQASFAEQSLRDLKMDPKRVTQLVKKTRADAWIVAGAPEEILEWFAAQSTPSFALFGRMRNVPISGVFPNKLDAIISLVDQLVALGHRRIVNIVAKERREPTIGLPERIYIEQLEKHGIQTSSYNLPHWEDSPENLPVLLDSLFKLTPPTALLVDQAAHFFAARDHLAQKGILVPKHLSMACYEWNPLFDWFRPRITHIDWDARAAVNRMVKWVNNASRGKDDRRKSVTQAKLISGGTIGPAIKR